jgi:hypothetical protein
LGRLRNAHVGSVRQLSRFGTVVTLWIVPGSLQERIKKLGFSLIPNEINGLPKTCCGGTRFDK